MRVAIVHYWLVGMRGGERVLERLLDLYPQADIFTHVYAPEAVSEKIRSRKVVSTFIQRLPFSRRMYQSYLPFMPRALERLDLSGYDLVISSESGPAKGVIPPPDATHVCYCHTPMRYIWDHQAQYRDMSGFVSRLGMEMFSNGLRIWDVSSAQRVDAFAANSSFVRQRIRKYYRRDATIIPPPVEIDQFRPSAAPGPGYLWVGQLISYKRPDIAVKAFNELGLPLLVVGTGGMERELKRIARPNVTFEAKLPYAKLKEAYANARALIFTAEEDFGIVPVEALASGRPVIAYGRGGVLDTVDDGKTGLFFGQQTPDSLIEAVRRFDGWIGDFDPAAAVEAARRCAPEAFDRAFLDLVAAAQRGTGREAQLLASP